MRSGTSCGTPAALPDRFSPRARPGTPVAVPITWKELRADFPPHGFTMEAARRRKGDAWRGFTALRQNLTRSIRKLESLTQGALS